MQEFELTIMSPEASLYEGKATSIVVPTLSGYIGILPGHTPLLSVLAPGEIRIKNDLEEKSIPLSGGIIDIDSRRVSIISN